jgi:hypothetical protein
VGQHLQQLDLSQRSDWKTILLIVHQNLLQGEDTACASLARFVDFTKCSLAELLQHLVFADLGTSLEPALQTILGRSCRRCRHSRDRCSFDLLSSKSCFVFRGFVVL